MRQRREFLARLAAAAVAAGFPAYGLADSDRRGTTSGGSGSTAIALPTTGLAGRVVVVGGGMAGASVAKFLRLWGGANVKVTIVEKEPRYISNILSNLVLTDTVTMAALQFEYTTLKSAYGIEVIQGTALAADPTGGRLTISTASGPRTLDFDRLVVAPGIDFEYPAGLETPAARAAIVHAWQAGPETLTLRSQIRAMPVGGVFVMTVPATPFRCPPGPYERACVVADWLKRNRPGSKVIVLDANPAIAAERTSFERAFSVTHAGIIQYVPNAPVDFVDVGTRTIHTPMGAFRGDAVNVIPTNIGPALLRDLGIANAPRGFAAVNVLDYQSTATDRIHVIGDSSSTTQPKAGHIGNQEGKVCADAILRAFGGGLPDPSPVTNSSCYSPITLSTASWLSAVFAYDPLTKTMQIVPGASGEATRANSEHFKDMQVWFGTLMRDTFA
ncbi:MAG: FAD-dependent oxidoreductase [Betaproteobacteria bacterium]|nr:FAD-dependent oxidoreductase [Betaproteobacteria bacterium]